MRFIESRVEGLRKPDPRIYERACSRLGLAASQAAFLDDIGANLKPARALGMELLAHQAEERRHRATRATAGAQPASGKLPARSLEQTRFQPQAAVTARGQPLLVKEEEKEEVAANV